MASPAGDDPPSSSSFVLVVSDLLHLCREISSLKTLRLPVLRRHVNSLLNKSHLLSFLLDNVSPRSQTPALLFFEELRSLLHKVKSLLQSSLHVSKLWVLLHYPSVAQNFYALTVELSVLLDIFPLNDVVLDDDVADVFHLLRKQCCYARYFVNPHDEVLRHQLITVLGNVKREEHPDFGKLRSLFVDLGLIDGSACREEIDSLQEKEKDGVVSLMWLTRYANCVLYGDELVKRAASNEALSYPVDFRCPVSLELMRDPVVVSTGQTYDRSSILLWVESGHDTCPKTGQSLLLPGQTRDDLLLIPNLNVWSAISSWCRENRLPYDIKGEKRVKNLTALGAVKLTVSFLVEKLGEVGFDVTANRYVRELRNLAKSDSDARGYMANSGVLPILIGYLVGSGDNPDLQVNAVTTVLNLSILGKNKMLIAENEGLLDGVIEVLCNGATWEAKGNAAATIFSLTSVHCYLVELGRMPNVIKGLVALGRDGPASFKRDALVAIRNLAKEKENVVRMVEEGVVEMACEAMEELQEGTVNVLELVVKRGGFTGISASYAAIKRLGEVLRFGSDRAREGAAGILVSVCRGGGAEAVAELAEVPGIERVVWELMGTGTERGRRKSASLLRILRKWATSLEGDAVSRMEFDSRLMINSEV